MIWLKGFYLGLGIRKKIHLHWQSQAVCCCTQKNEIVQVHTESAKISQQAKLKMQEMRQVQNQKVIINKLKVTMEE